MGESLPHHQLQHLPVRRTKPLDGVTHERHLSVLATALGSGPGLLGEPGLQSSPSPARSARPRHASSRNGVQPELVFRRARDVIKPPPSNRENVRHDVGHVPSKARQPTMDVGVNRGVVLDVDELEPLLAGLLTTIGAHHTRYMPTSTQILSDPSRHAWPPHSSNHQHLDCDPTMRDRHPPETIRPRQQLDDPRERLAPISPAGGRTHQRPHSFTEFFLRRSRGVIPQPNRAQKRAAHVELLPWDCSHPKRLRADSRKGDEAAHLPVGARQPTLTHGLARGVPPSSTNITDRLDGESTAALQPAANSAATRRDSRKEACGCSVMHGRPAGVSASSGCGITANDGMRLRLARSARPGIWLRLLQHFRDYEPRTVSTTAITTLHTSAIAHNQACGQGTPDARRRCCSRGIAAVSTASRGDRFPSRACRRTRSRLAVGGACRRRGGLPPRCCRLSSARRESGAGAARSTIAELHR